MNDSIGRNVVVLGTQWGDEGKGKIIDFLTDRVDAVVRFQGGHNAGHTVIVDGDKTILHIVPSGILREEIRCFLGNGVVLSPQSLFDEVSMLEQKAVSVRDRLKISESCTLLLPYHAALDQARESAKGSEAIGTTGRGISPAYEDKVGRRALQAGELAHKDKFARKLSEVMDFYNFVLREYFAAETVDYQATLDATLALADWLAPMVGDVTGSVCGLQEAGGNILFEGAQGALLDINHGTYPFVTSSNTTIGGVLTGTGLSPRAIDYVLGVTKAYTTRVGSGPFPTESFDEDGLHMADKGSEFGATTGRKRRCGWLDMVALRQANRVNGLDGLCVTKLDVLDGLDSIKICTAYNYRGRHLLFPPQGGDAITECSPVYEEMPGWSSSTSGLVEYDDLPGPALDYLNRLQTLAGVPIEMVSTGPERNQTIILNHPLDR